MYFLPSLAEYLRDLPEEAVIPEKRRRVLGDLAAYLSALLAEKKTIPLVFICTHNSRRSQFAQVWASVMAARHGVERVHAYSGGTEATAFNPRAAAALRRIGFQVHAEGSDNPVYTIRFATDAAPTICFSKVYDHPSNPSSDFVAVMTCSEADAGCPFVAGASFRQSLPYGDPKEYDDTPEEAGRYDERCAQIALEMNYLFSMLKK